MLKVLVADDDSGLRLAVKTALQATGRFEIDEAFDGVNALEKFKTARHNVVILDVDMPRMNGLETLRQLFAAYPFSVQQQHGNREQPVQLHL